MAGRGSAGGLPPHGGVNYGNQPLGRQGFRGQGFNGARDDRGFNHGNGGFDRMGNSSVNGNQGSQGYPQMNSRASGPSNFERGEGSGATTHDRRFDQRGAQQGEFRGNFEAYNEGSYERGNRNFQGNTGNFNNQRYRNNQGNFGIAGQGRGGAYGRGRSYGRGGGFPPRSNAQADNLSTGSMDLDQEKAPSTVAVYKPKEVVNVDQQDNTQQLAKGGALVQHGKAKNKPDKTLCFRCKCTGHIGTDCTSTLCVFCDSALHSDDACPLPKMPKPTAILYGMARECLMFFKVNKSDNLRLKNESGKVGRIRLSGGKLSAPQVLKELEWLIPGDHAWEIYPAGDGDFRVVFPTKADFSRLKRIKCIEVEGTDISMHFEDWTSKLCDKWGLYDIWVRISGCPEPLCRDYLALFAVGSLIGETKEVDMKFTREHGIVRARIDCASPEGIPRSLDFLYEGEGYGVLFDIEAEDGTIVAAGDFVMHDPNADEDNKKKDHENHEHEKGLDEKNNGSSAENKKSDETLDQTEKMDTDDKPSEAIEHIQFGTVSFSPKSQKQDKFQAVHFEYFTPSPKLAAVRTCVSAPQKLWGDKVEDEEESLPSPLQFSAPPQPRPSLSCSEFPSAMEANGGNVAAKCNPESLGHVITSVTAASSAHADQRGSEETHASSALVLDGSSSASVMSSGNFEEMCDGNLGAAVSPGSTERTPPSPARSSLMSTPISHVLTSPRHKAKLVSDDYPISTPEVQEGQPISTPTKGTGVFLGGRFSQEEIIAYGGIPEARAKEARSSSRVQAQANADDTQLARAQKRLQERDDLGTPGYTDGYTLDPYMVLPTVNGQARRNGFWVQPPGIGRVGSIFPVQLAF